MELHGPADKDTNEDAEQAACEHQNQRLVEVQKCNSDLAEAHSPKNSNLFGLVVEVGAHGRAEREEAEEHHDGNSNHEDILDCVPYSLC